jgi:hypothetical protein
MGLCLGYSTYKIFDKRSKRNPEGNSPLFGAFGMSLLGIAGGFLVNPPPPSPVASRRPFLWQ